MLVNLAQPSIPLPLNHVFVQHLQMEALTGCVYKVLI